MALESSNVLDVPIDYPPDIVWASEFLVLQPLDFTIESTKHWGLDIWDSRGWIEICRKNILLEISPGSITLTPPRSKIHACFPKGRKSLYVAFDTSKQCREKESIPYLSFPGDTLGEMEETVKSVIRFLAVKPYHANRIFWNMLCTIIELSQKNNVSVVKHPLVRQAIDWIALNLDRNFTVTELAEILNSSQTQLSRLFRHHLDCRLTDYIRHLRVHKACIFLTHTASPIKEIAARVGIPDAQYFNKIIRRTTGMSPSALRDHK